ncbi:MAG: hypothetical protein K2Z81_11720, partial [Cyanobacteria bacterium]|nr:hypothetical protein [Cyanobacteriota bacterium]
PVDQHSINHDAGSSHQQSEPEPELALDFRTFPVERYRPLSLLGSGTSSNVYLGRDRLLLKKVAIKIMHATAGEAQVVAFLREAKANILVDRIDSEQRHNDFAGQSRVDVSYAFLDRDLSG